MFDFNTKVTGRDVQSKMQVVAETQQKLYKSVSKLIGDVVTDYDLVGKLTGADDESTRTATNYMQVIATSKEYADKLMEANVELAAAIDALTRRQKEIDGKLLKLVKLDKLDKIIELLEKKDKKD
jgi:hypothetical protein